MAGRKVKKSFEDNLEELDNIISEMESGELDLDKSVEKYKEGMNLLAKCQEILNSAEGKVQKIMVDNSKINYEEFE